MKKFIYLLFLVLVFFPLQNLNAEPFTKESGRYYGAEDWRSCLEDGPKLSNRTSRSVIGSSFGIGWSEWCYQLKAKSIEDIQKREKAESCVRKEIEERHAYEGSLPNPNISREKSFHFMKDIYLLRLYMCSEDDDTAAKYDSEKPLSDTSITLKQFSRHTDIPSGTAANSEDNVVQSTAEGINAGSIILSLGIMILLILMVIDNKTEKGIWGYFEDQRRKGAFFFICMIALLLRGLIDLFVGINGNSSFNTVLGVITVTLFFTSILEHQQARMIFFHYVTGVWCVLRGIANIAILQSATGSALEFFVSAPLTALPNIIISYFAPLVVGCAFIMTARRLRVRELSI